MTLTKQYTFILPIPPEYLRDWKGPQPGVYIRYSLDRRGVVEVKWFTMHPDVSTIVTDWEGLKVMMQEAAESNAENHKGDFRRRLAPGFHRPPLPQPGEDPWFDAQMELNWK